MFLSVLPVSYYTIPLLLCKIKFCTDFTHKTAEYCFIFKELTEKTAALNKPLVLTIM